MRAEDLVEHKLPNLPCCPGCLTEISKVTPVDQVVDQTAHSASRPGDPGQCVAAPLERGAARLDPQTLVYLDPPYLRSTRTRAFYPHEFDSNRQHFELLAVLRGLKCRVMLSGYPSRLYSRMLGSWRCVSYQAMTRGGLRTECLWMNFPPLALPACRCMMSGSWAMGSGSASGSGANGIGGGGSSRRCQWPNAR